MEKVNVQIYIKSSECELHFSDDKDKTVSFLAANSLLVVKSTEMFGHPS